MNRFSIFRLITVGCLALSVACTIADQKAPPLAGPSELALSLILAANPDVLSIDGASQSQIVIEARDANGQLVSGAPLRAEIIVNGTAVDYGDLSTKNFVTGSNGRATVTYTSPAAVIGSTQVQTAQTISIKVTPTGTDSASALGRFVSIRLVPPGVITGGLPTPSFTVTPASPAAFTDVRFDASASTAAFGAAVANYAWEFGDGSTGSGVAPTHQFAEGSFRVMLSITDTNGIPASKSQTVTVGPGTAPTADFTFSPSSPAVNQNIQFNGSTSKAATGHTLVRYDWNFGSGVAQSGVLVTKSYDTSGTYTVTLKVTDDVGQVANTSKSVAISNAGGPLFIVSPTNPKIGTTVNFNGGPSTAPPGLTISSYAWQFGDGAVGSGQITSHVYAGAFTYVVRLTVTYSDGSTATVTQSLTVGA